MRRMFVAVAMAGVLSASSAFAQDDESRVQVVGQTSDAPANVLGLQYHSNLALSPGVGYTPGLTLVYERAFSDAMSLAIQPGLYFGGATSFGLDLDLRFALMGEALNGLYLAPTAGFWLTSAGTLVPGFNVGALIGYSYLINNMIQVGAGVGVTLNGTFTAAGSSFGVGLPIRVTVGFAF